MKVVEVLIFILLFMFFVLLFILFFEMDDFMFLMLNNMNILMLMVFGWKLLVSVGFIVEVFILLVLFYNKCVFVNDVKWL